MRPLVLILLFALLVISQINTVADSDIWCHLKTGEYIVKNLNVPQVDLFSYTLENQAWIDHEWLFQVLLYPIFAKFSWLGVSILKVIIISLCFSTLIFFVYSRYKKLSYVVFFTVLSVLAFGYRSFARPEIFSYLLACLFFCILEDERRLCILPLLQILWVNLHGYFILGPMLISLYCLGHLIAGNAVKAKKSAVILSVTIVACFINPYFYKGVFYPIKVLMNIFTEQGTSVQDIRELIMPVSVSFRSFIFFWVLAVLSSITFLINLRKAKMQHILIFLGAFIASYAAMRNMPVFIFIAMPLAVINLNEARLTKGIGERKHYAICILIILAAVYFFASNEYYVFTKQSAFRNAEFKMANFFMPSKACDFLENNYIKGRIFNNIDFGHYIAYRFYPEKRILIDVRTDLYKRDFYQAYKNAQNYPKEWERLQEKYNFNIALLMHLSSSTERLLRYLYNNKEWAMVYYDEISVVFLRDTAENKENIKKFRIDFSKKKISKQDENINIAVFFGKIEEVKLAEEAHVKILERKPKFLEAGNNLAVIYINSERYEEALKIIDKFLKYYPKSAELYCNKGTVYLRMGKKEEGLLMLEKSAKLNPYLRQASYMLGLVYFERGNTEKAMRQFVKYLKLNPYNGPAHKMLGDIYTQKGLLKEADAEYNEADRLEGE